MIQICTLKSLENVKPFYYITKDLEIINANNNNVKSIWYSKRGGYPMVSLEQYGSKKSRNVPVHKIVALAFIENRDDYILIEHLDDNPLNYKPENLMFSNHSNNGKRAFINGHPNRVEKLYFVSLWNGFMCIGTMKEISKWTGIKRMTLYDHLYRKRKSKTIQDVLLLKDISGTKTGLQDSETVVNA